MRVAHLPFLICLLLVAPPGFAKDIKATGIGVQTCTAWTSWKTAKNGELRAMAIEWSFGLIAGHNIYSSAAGETSGSVVVDSKVLTALLDSFCEKYPEQRILNAVADIIQSLGGTKINVAPKNPGASGAPGSPGTIRPPGLDPKKQKGTAL